MRLDRALAELDEIHAQVLRSEVYRGYRARTCLLTGGLVLAAAAVDAIANRMRTPESFALYWSSIALICGGVAVVEIFTGGGARRESSRRTLTTAAQFVPALIVGAALPWLLLRGGDRAFALLPGLWSALFGLGLFASLPYLPRAVAGVALYYVVGGVILAAVAPDGPPSPWSLGVPFAVGQAASAFVLRRSSSSELRDAPSED
jgi:hypothetical protein